MENSDAAERSLEEQQRTNDAQRESEHVAWRRNFALVFALIVLTLIVATVLANWSASETVRL